MVFDDDITPPSNPNKHEINTHHVYGGPGRDQFYFDDVDNVTTSGVRLAGRFGDFDPSSDPIYVDGQEVDLYKLPSNVRVVSFQGQQWMLINDNILYGLDGARLVQGTTTDEEEGHFVDFPTAWLNGIPASADVNFVDPVNFVPLGQYENLGLATQFIGSQTYVGTNSSEHIFSNKDIGHTSQSINAEGGDDIVDAGHGNDTVYGGDGKDIIAGGLGKDSLYGDLENDVLYWGLIMTRSMVAAAQI